MEKLLIVYCVLTAYSLISLFTFLFFWRREVKIRDKSTEKVKGTVIGYYISTRLKTPIVEYFVNNRRFKQRLRYYPMGKNMGEEIFNPETVEEHKQKILEPRYVYYINPVPYPFKTFFPIGSEMMVYYNPKNPRLSYVERYAGLINYHRNALLVVFIQLVSLKACH
ncbi:hypothetical protein ABID29_001025 [Streptococcus rupicaprae]|uniref:DUF3592 domain-containing protein n=1 Tax=Streptococcus rupicaprae TaxID=759619 RepID=A0ABV2FH86_9STRE